MLQDLPLIVVGGLLGSGHCIGMCGAFALSIGAASTNWKTNMARQVTFGLGRIATYSTMGAIAGFIGLRMNQSLAALLPVQAILAIFAGGLLLVQGMYATGIRRREVAERQHPCLLPRFLSTFIRSPGWTGAFMAGVFTGFLPCGLVYAFLVLATVTQSMFAGWLTMLAFGLGTMPIMIATGLGANVLSLAARQRTLQIAGWCVMIAGTLTVLRGVGILDAIAPRDPMRVESNHTNTGGELPANACPFCRS